MGKRKRATKPPPKKKTAKLEKIFNCPMCGHEESVECVIDRSKNMGSVECRICSVKFSAMIHNLEEEVDVYAKWIDALDRANENQEHDKQDSEERVEDVDVPVDPGDVRDARVDVGGLADVDDDGDADDFA